jgi:hypothetical protein
LINKIFKKADYCLQNVFKKLNLMMVVPHLFFHVKASIRKKRLVFNHVDKNQDLYLPSLRSVLNDQIVQGSKPGRNFVSGVGCLLRVLRRL